MRLLRPIFGVTLCKLVQLPMNRSHVVDAVHSSVDEGHDLETLSRNLPGVGAQVENSIRVWGVSLQPGLIQGRHQVCALEL